MTTPMDSHHNGQSSARRALIVSVALAVCLGAMAAPAGADGVIDVSDKLEVDAGADAAALDVKLANTGDVITNLQVQLGGREALGAECAVSATPTTLTAKAVTVVHVEMSECDLDRPDRLTMAFVSSGQTLMTTAVTVQHAAGLPWQMLWTALLFGFVFALLLMVFSYLQRRAPIQANAGERVTWRRCLKRELPGMPVASWKLSESFVTNLTFLGAFIATVLAATDLLGRLATKSEIAVFTASSIAAAAVAGAAPLLLHWNVAKYQKDEGEALHLVYTVEGLHVAAGATLTAACTQLALIGWLVHVSNNTPLPLKVALDAMLALAVISVAVYIWNTIRALVYNASLTTAEKPSMATTGIM